MALNDIPGEAFIPPRAWPKLRNRVDGPAFGYQPSESTPAGDRRMADPSPWQPPAPFRFVAVNPTAFSAGNKVRTGIVGVLSEWWRGRPIMTGAIFVADSKEFRRVPARRLARPRRLDRLVNSAQVTYAPKMYGEGS